MSASHLSPAQFAKEAGLSVKSVYTYVRSGKIRAVQNRLSGRVLIPSTELDRIFAPAGQIEAEQEVLPAPEPPRPRRPASTSAPIGKEDFYRPTVTPLPQPVNPAVAARAALLHGIEQRFGQEGRQKLEAGWSAGLDQTIGFVLKIAGGINAEKLARTIAALPDEVLNFPPVTWLPPVISAAGEPVLPPEPAPYLTGDDAAELLQPEETEEVEELEPEPELRTYRPPKRQTAPPPRRVRLPRAEAGVCPSCSQEDGHAPGCPVGMQEITEEVSRRGGHAGSRFSSPRAEAANARAFANRALRNRAGVESAIPEGFEFCTDPGCMMIFHRMIQLPGRSGHFIGHLKSDFARAAEVEGIVAAQEQETAQETLRRAGPPPPAQPFDLSKLAAQEASIAADQAAQKKALAATVKKGKASGKGKTTKAAKSPQKG